MIDMNLKRFFLLIFSFLPLFSVAQKIEHINSGTLIDSAAKLSDSARHKAAIALLNKINRSDTNYVKCLLQKSIVLEADSQYNQAIKVCQEALSLKENREFEPDLYNTYGNVLDDMGEREKAIEIFDKGIAKYPAYSLLYFNKGIAYRALNKNADAEVWFKKALIINPYMYSAHYQLGEAAVRQGKIIPAFISFMAYLLVSPEGRYHSSAIKYLSQITTNADVILEFKNSRTEQPSPAYQEIEDIITSKIALQAAYKPIISIDDPISRQMQALVEKLEYKADDTDFWMQYYMPYFKKVYAAGKFEPFVFHMFSGVQLDAVTNYTKKNKKLLDDFVNDAADYFNIIRRTRQLYFARRDTVKQYYFFNDGKLSGLGTLTANSKSMTGPWKGYYSTGNKKSIGQYDASGERTGDWVFYTFSGALDAREHYVSGKLEGVQDYYFENGNLTSHELYQAGQLNGVSTSYYYNGNPKVVANYKLGKKDGVEKTYYSNGALNRENTWINGVVNGQSRGYFKSGKLKDTKQYLNDKLDGPFKLYNESGTLATEGQYAKDKAEGEWKYYYANGKLKVKATYIADKENGTRETYTDDGKLSETYTAKNDQIIGDQVQYFKDGKVFSRRTYTDGVLSACVYYDKNGKELSSAKVKNGLLNVVAFDQNGFKESTAVYDNKGLLTGTDTLYHASGKIKQINNFENGELNGSAASYFINGKKKNEMTMRNGEQDGYYANYYSNGKLQSEGWMENGQNAGEWRNYDECGMLTSRSYYQNGDLDGYREEFYPDGKKSTEYKYYRGWIERLTQFDDAGKVIADDYFPKCSGKYKLLFQNGKVMVETMYKNGDFDGPYKEYFFDGSIAKSLFYKRGDLDSIATTYFYGGKKSGEGTFKTGQKEGPWNIYDEDGKLARVLNYAGNEVNGNLIYYLPDGKKDFVSVYKDDELQGSAQKFDPKGDLAYQVNYEGGFAKSYTYMDKDGKLVPEIMVDVKNGVVKTFFQNGKPSRECTFADGIKNGDDKIYYANGQLRSIDHLAFNDTQGVSKTYYEDGKLKSEYNYVDDNTDGICRDYYANGKLKKETTYANGINHGPARYYNENGKLVKTMMYYYGNLTAVSNEK